MQRLRHRVIWSILRFPVAIFLKIKFNYTCVQAGKVNAPFILISNHVTDLDPLMVGCSFSQQMYFVASEHLFRKGLLSKLLVWLVAPIARIKGATDSVSAFSILRTLKQGANIGLFAEGDKSWNGITNSLHPTTARLIKASRASLVTYRISGGYLSSPRWSTTIRRGKMTGRVVNVYTPQQLAAMTESELVKAVSDDIYEHAYEAQHEAPVRYRGKNLAENLERAIYTCPACRSVCTMHSRGDQFFCSCGLSVRYNEYGSFEGAERPFATVAEWDAWQDEFLQALVLSVGEVPIFEDADQCLWHIGSGHTEELIAMGTLRLYADRLELGSFTVSLTSLSQMGVYGPAHVVFTADGLNYEIRFSAGRSGRKYLTMYRLLTGAADNDHSTVNK